MDILLAKDGDLCFDGADIILVDSVLQKIKIRLKWFFSEWRWDEEAGLPYFEYLLVKNPDMDLIRSLIREQIFNVDEVTEVREISIDVDRETRRAKIAFVAETDEETYREEVMVYG